MLKQLLDHAISLVPVKQWPTYDDKALDRSEFLTSSEVASCLRQSYFSKQGASSKGGNFSNGYAERGHAIEEWLVDKLRYLESIGYIFTYVGDEQRSFYDAELGISGTPDGLMLTPTGEYYLLEFKSIDPRTNKNYLPKLKHKYQVQQNMYLMQKCLNIKLTGAILFYIDASDLFSINEFAISYDDKVVNECIGRSNDLWEAEQPDDLEPEGLYNGDCERCPYTGACSATIKMQKALSEVGAAGSNFSASELPSRGEALLSEEETELVTDFLYARKERMEFEEKEEELKPHVSKLVNHRNGLVVVDGSILSVSTEPGRRTIDKTLLERAGLDPNDFTKTGKPYNVLRVKG